MAEVSPVARFKCAIRYANQTGGPCGFQANGINFLAPRRASEGLTDLEPATFSSTPT